MHFRGIFDELEYQSQIYSKNKSIDTSLLFDSDEESTQSTRWH